MSHEVVVRFVDTWDKGEIVELYHAGGWWKDDYNPDDLPLLIRGSFAFAVAVETTTGRAAGMGRVISDGVSDAYIQDLVVLPRYRKCGIGRMLVEALVNRCRASGISWIGLIAEPGTEQFYLPAGFHAMEGHVPLILRCDR